MRAYDRAAMKCPHCQTAFNVEANTFPIDADVDGGWMASSRKCPECHRLIVWLLNGDPLFEPGSARFICISSARRVFLARPRNGARPVCPKEVPPAVGEDYNEACLVLADSPKASAALSRRCLQNVLVDAAKVKSRDLYDQIEEVLAANSAPSYVADKLHAVRVVGKIAAHGIKSQRTGEILPVEPHEAEWNLDTLESVFDFYYVQPRRHQEREDALNGKLREAGKQPIPKRVPPNTRNEK